MYERAQSPVTGEQVLQVLPANNRNWTKTKKKLKMKKEQKERKGTKKGRKRNEWIQYKVKDNVKNELETGSLLTGLTQWIK